MVSGEHNRLVAIVGPTGVGKSRLALGLARAFDGEIVNADSRQMYRYMDIGTAKPSPRELASVSHHLFSIIDPDEDFSLARYLSLASGAISDIQRRGKLPLLAGGSGQYVWALLEDWGVPPVPPDPDLRRELERRAESGEAGQLYDELMHVDPEAARAIDSRNVRRVIRALEVTLKAGVPFSLLRSRRGQARWRTLIIGLTADRGELYRRLDSRVDEMIAKGLVAELEKLAGMEYDFKLPALSSIGYRQIGQYLKGEVGLEEAVRQIKYETHRFVRHQYAWFRLKDDRICWFDILKDSQQKIEETVAKFMGSDTDDEFHQDAECRERLRAGRGD